MLFNILLLLLFFMVLGAIPTWPHSRGWGYYPSGGLGLVLLVLIFCYLQVEFNQKNAVKKVWHSIHNQININI